VTRPAVFCYISDLVEGICRLLVSDRVDPINIGNPREMTVLQIAEQIIAQTGSKSRIIFRDLPEDDPKTRQPDISEAKQVLGWEPVVGLEDGLTRTIEYFKEKLGMESDRA